MENIEEKKDLAETKISDKLNDSIEVINFNSSVKEENSQITLESKNNIDINTQNDEHDDSYDKYIKNKTTE
jgi:hypothetical protein